MYAWRLPINGSSGFRLLIKLAAAQWWRQSALTQWEGRLEDVRRGI